MAFGYSSGGASQPRLVAEGARKRSAAGRRVRSTPPTGEYAKHRVNRQLSGHKTGTRSSTHLSPTVAGAGSLEGPLATARISAAGPGCDRR